MRALFRIMMIYCVLLFSVTVSAQTESPTIEETLQGTFEFENGATLQHPENWETGGGLGFIGISAETLFIAYDFEGLSQLGFTPNLPMRDVIAGYISTFHPNHTINPIYIDPIRVGERNAFSYEYISPIGFHSILIVLETEDGRYATFEAGSLRAEFVELPTAFLIAESYRVVENPDT